MQFCNISSLPLSFQLGRALSHAHLAPDQGKKSAFNLTPQFSVAADPRGLETENPSISSQGDRSENSVPIFLILKESVCRGRQCCCEVIVNPNEGGWKRLPGNPHIIFPHRLFTVRLPCQLAGLSSHLI